MKRIDFSVKKNITEKWAIESTGMGMGMGMMTIPHSFHVHDVQFSIVSINGQKPPPFIQALKIQSLSCRETELKLLSYSGNIPEYTCITAIFLNMKMRE